MVFPVLLTATFLEAVTFTELIALDVSGVMVTDDAFAVGATSAEAPIPRSSPELMNMFFVFCMGFCSYLPDESICFIDVLAHHFSLFLTREYCLVAFHIYNILIKAQ